MATFSKQNGGLVCVFINMLTKTCDYYRLIIQYLDILYEIPKVKVWPIKFTTIFDIFQQVITQCDNVRRSRAFNFKYLFF